MDDHQLLRSYVESHSEPAFAEVVGRHLPLVYGTALRMLQNPSAAEEVAQAVFIQLARKAWSVRPGSLPGWLYRTTRRAALNHQRSEHRRLRRETDAMNLAEQNSDTAAAWEALAPLLDEALSQLARTEQDVLLLRYVEGCSIGETGRQLALSEAAAQKRISRALEKLRGHFARQGVVASAALLASTLSTHAASPLPPALTVKIQTSAVAGAMATAGTTSWISWLIFMTTKKVLLILAVLIVAAITAIAIKSSLAEPQDISAPAPVVHVATAPVPAPTPGPPVVATLPVPTVPITATPVAVTDTPPPSAPPNTPAVNPQTDLNAVIPDIVSLIQTNDMVALWMKYTPPSVIAPLLLGVPPNLRQQFTRGAIEQIAADPTFKDFINHYVLVLESIKDTQPTVLEDKAVYHANLPDGTAGNIMFVKENGLWYCDIKTETDPNTGAVRGFSFNTSVNK